jgi:UDP-N-acetylglucosamine 4,6-dehydratase/5-epimerase
VKSANKIKNQFKGKKILITGGTGSIGTEIVRQLIKFKPQTIRILTNDENSIFDSKRIHGNNVPVTYFIGDIREKERIKLAIRDIDIVFHAAAMKHVDICEQNPFDAVKTNVIGTANVLEASILENISKFILISTDKATTPTSTLGASKLLAERLTLDATSYVGTGKTIFSTVRFGNVIGSRGSVFQIFLDQIKQGLPVTVTDKKMTRFIMSTSEAASLILDITAIAQNGDTFILKMPSVRIEDLAKKMIEVCNEKIVGIKKISKIKIIKPKQGERFDELLVTNDEILYCHDLGKIFKISRKENKKSLDIKEFSSESTHRISQEKLKKLIIDLLDKNQ